MMSARLRISMPWSPFDRYVVERRDGSVRRGCPFCGEKIEDEDGKDIKFLVHMGMQTTKHSGNKEWQAYINRIRPPL